MGASANMAETESDVTPHPGEGAPAATFMGLMMTEREFEAKAKSYFNRFDTDGSKHINSAAELNQLVTNLTFYLKIPKYCNNGGAALIEAAIKSKGDLDKNPITDVDFIAWFKEEFLSNSEGVAIHQGHGIEEHLKICCITWNVGNAMPEHDLTPFFAKGGEDYDIIAVGGQEAQYDQKVPAEATPIAAEATYMNGSKRKLHHWFGCLQTHLGDEWQPVESVELLEMRLIVFARKNKKVVVKDIESATEATGLMHIVGNKGGLL